MFQYHGRSTYGNHSCNSHFCNCGADLDPGSDARTDRDYTCSDGDSHAGLRSIDYQ